MIVTDFLILAGLLFVYMSSWFVLSYIKARNDVADVAWGLGFVLLAWASLFLGSIMSIRGIIITLLVTIWGVRLAWHIHKRNKGKTEDYRYQKWREEWGKWFYVRSYFQVYILQGFLLFCIVTPVLLINITSDSALVMSDYIGIAIWVFGFIFESVGDAQLAKFLSDQSNKGKLIQTGLWRYTRHPNYFGEVSMWWGIWVVASSLPYGLYTILGPITITFLILKVSGIPMLEKKMEENPEFAEYKRKTSVFIPWFPKA